MSCLREQFFEADLRREETLVQFEEISHSVLVAEVFVNLLEEEDVAGLLIVRCGVFIVFACLRVGSDSLLRQEIPVYVNGSQQLI